MKIAILGTKGVPNNYGGFEQFAECLSVRLAARGHSVTVYNPHFHPYKSNHFEGVAIKRIYSPENLMGAAANFIYDHLCLSDALKSNYDILYEAGYHSVALSYAYFGVRRLKKPILLTNMDGLEWKRSKWNKLTRSLIRRLEKLAVKQSPILISDNEGIQKYYKETFQRDSWFIPYGAEPITVFDESNLGKYNVAKAEYSLLIARLEPENNIETILEGYRLSCDLPLIIVGNQKTKYGRFLQEKFSDNKFRFVGSIYEKSVLDSLRHFALAYFHGHSVGGTNPSLLEAMATRSFIIAHDNPFNRSVLRGNALFFTDSISLAELMTQVTELRNRHFGEFTTSNFELIKDEYNWDKITTMHEDLFKELMSSKK